MRYCELAMWCMFNVFRQNKTIIMLFCVDDKRGFEMPKIEAKTWHDAEMYCKQNNLKLVGEFVEEIPAEKSLVNFYQTQLN